MEFILIMVFHYVLSGETQNRPDLTPLQGLCPSALNLERFGGRMCLGSDVLLFFLPERSRVSHFLFHLDVPLPLPLFCFLSIALICLFFLLKDSETMFVVLTV